MVLSSQKIHYEREIDSWRKKAMPEGIQDNVMELEAFMKVLSELPSEWVKPSRIYEKVDGLEDVNPTRRTMRRWIKKLESEGYVKTRGKTRNREVYSLVDGRKSSI